MGRPHGASRLHASARLDRLTFLAAQTMNPAALIYHRQAFLDGQWWLPLTAQIAHFNVPHALVNSTGAFLLWCLFRTSLNGLQQTAAILGGGDRCGLGGCAGQWLYLLCGRFRRTARLGGRGALLWWKGTPAHDRPQRRLAMAIAVSVFFRKSAWQWASAAGETAWGFPVIPPGYMQLDSPTAHREAETAKAHRG